MNPYKFMRRMAVSSKTDATKLAGAMTAHIKEIVRVDTAMEFRYYVELRCIGASSINQSIKAVAIANGMLAPVGVQLTVKPSFVDVFVNDEDKTAVRLTIQREVI